MEIGRRDGDWWARRLLAKDNLDLSVWKEACPLVKRIIKPYLTSNYIFFFKHAAPKQFPPQCDPLIVCGGSLCM